MLVSSYRLLFKHNESSRSFISTRTPLPLGEKKQRILNQSSLCVSLPTSRLPYIFCSAGQFLHRQVGRNEGKWSDHRYVVLTFIAFLKGTMVVNCLASHEKDNTHEWVPCLILLSVFSFCGTVINSFVLFVFMRMKTVLGHSKILEVCAWRIKTFTVMSVRHYFPNVDFLLGQKYIIDGCETNKFSKATSWHH